MTKSQQLLIKLSERRQAQALMILPGEDGKVAATEAELDAETKAIAALEQEYRTAVQTEERETGSAFDGHDGDLITPNAENRAIMEVRNRADLSTMVRRAMDHHEQRGAEAELQSAFGLEGRDIPMVLLSGEMRAFDIDIGGGPVQWMQYYFPASIAPFMNIRRPSVPPGVHSFPSISAPTTPTRAAEAATVADSDPTPRTKLLTPNRIQASTQISQEDRRRYPNMASAVAAHLMAACRNALDSAALNGDDGFFDASSGPLTIPANPGSGTTAPQYRAMQRGGIDGRVALDFPDVRLLCGMEMYGDADGLTVTNTADTILDVLRRRGRVQVSDALPDVSSNIGLVLRILGNLPGAVQPIWAGLQLDDPYTNAATGMTTLTAGVYADFHVQHPSHYAVLKYHNG